MKSPFISLAALLMPLLPAASSAALTWANYYAVNHQYASTNLYEDQAADPENYDNPVRQLWGGLVTAQGSILTTYNSTPRGYWIDFGYRGSGPRTTYGPGYSPFSVAAPASPYGIPSAPNYSILKVRSLYDSTVTATSDFTYLKEGALPAGSWLYFNFEDQGGGDINGDAILTVKSSTGWNDIFWTPSGDGEVELISATSDQLTFQGSGAVYLRTSSPLASLTWTATDPTPYADTANLGQFTSYVEVSYGIAANIPEPSAAMSVLLAGGCLMMGGRRRSRPAS